MNVWNRYPIIDTTQSMKALSQLKYNKSPGEGGISIEMLKITAEQLIQIVRIRHEQVSNT